MAVRSPAARVRIEPCRSVSDHVAEGIKSMSKIRIRNWGYPPLGGWSRKPVRTRIKTGGLRGHTRKPTRQEASDTRKQFGAKDARISRSVLMLRFQRTGPTKVLYSSFIQIWGIFRKRKVWREASPSLTLRACVNSGTDTCLCLRPRRACVNSED